MKIAPTVTLGLLGEIVTVQLLGPAAVTGAVAVQLSDHPPKAAPVDGAVKVTVVPIGYGAAHTEPPVPPFRVQPGPQ